MSGPQKIESDRVRYTGDGESLNPFGWLRAKNAAAFLYFCAAIPAGWGFASTVDKIDVGVFSGTKIDLVALGLCALCGFAALFSLAQMFNTLRSDG